MKNFLLGQRVPPVFQHLEYTESLTLTPYDAPYYAVRAVPVNNPAGITDPYTDFPSDGWARIGDVSGGPVLDELHFLELLGLAVKQRDIYYVYRLADVFYAPEKGMFARWDDTVTPAEKRAIVADAIQLFRSYVLPGRYWRNYYARIHLADNVGLSTGLDAEMGEIAATWAGLEREFS